MSTAYAATAYAACPKCGHQPPTPIDAMEACPACGVYMHKWQQIQDDAQALAADSAPTGKRARTTQAAPADESQMWGEAPDARALYFAETYEGARADLKGMTGSA